MKAVLLVGHGSRNGISNLQFIEFAEKVKACCAAPYFRYAFLELAEPSIVDQLKVCVENGIKEIIVYPLLLLSAGHAKYDIPNEIKRAQELLGDLQVHLENPLGIQDVLLSILEARLREKQYVPSSNNLIVFVGRGSNDPEAISDFEEIGQRLKERIGGYPLMTSYLVGGHLSFENCIKEAKQFSYQHVYVLPYLLFQGLLMKGIKKQVNAQEDERFVVCQPIGNDKELIVLVSDIINQAMT